MALAAVGQNDFGAGIYRGRKAPDSAVYDCVNGLINDEGLIYKRGGSEYKTTSDAGAALLGVADGETYAGARTLTWSGSQWYALDAAETGYFQIGSGAVILPFTRPVRIGAFIAVPHATDGGIRMYGGSRKANYSTGTITATNGSTTITGAGTSWTANADKGMFVSVSAVTAVIESVDSDTQITLRDAWTGSGATAGAGLSYSLSAIRVRNINSQITSAPYLAAAGQRLLVAWGSKVWYTSRGALELVQNAAPISDAHELASYAGVIGADSLADVGVIFTTAGVWRIGNLYLDDVDAFGNIQHTVEHFSKDVILWGDPGIAAWQGALLVPALDDIYIMGLDGPLGTVTGDSENEKVRRLYRSYVNAGYQPGTASVHRGHYFLPVVNGTTWVDTLVCRLDRGAAWTRWSGHSAGVAFAQRVGSSTRTPKLFAASGQRVIDVTGAFDSTADNAAEADATVPDLTIITRDYPTGGNQHGFVKKLRARYECVDGGTPDPAVAVAFSSDQDAGSFTTLTEKGLQEGGSGWATSDGSKYQWAIVGKRRERIRFRLTVSGACASFVLRSLELLLRPTGRQ